MKISILLVSLLLAGCSASFRTTIANEGAQVADAGLENSIWYICKGTTVGSIWRRFGVSVHSMEVYNDFCQLSNIEVDLLQGEADATETGS